MLVDSKIGGSSQKIVCVDTKENEKRCEARQGEVR